MPGIWGPAFAAAGCEIDLHLVEGGKVAETVTALDAPVVAVGEDQDGRRIEHLRWGLVPRWAKDLKTARSRFAGARRSAISVASDPTVIEAA